MASLRYNVDFPRCRVSTGQLVRDALRKRSFSAKLRTSWLCRSTPLPIFDLFTKTAFFYLEPLLPVRRCRVGFQRRLLQSAGRRPAPRRTRLRRRFPAGAWRSVKSGNPGVSFSELTCLYLTGFSRCSSL